MKVILGRALMGTLALAGLVGSLLGSRALNRATLAGHRYTIDMAAAQMESDLEYETQESRRSFLHAMAEQNSMRRLPYAEAERQADGRVLSAVERLRALSRRETIGYIENFAAAWEEYSRARDRMAESNSDGNAAAALTLEGSAGQPAFAAAIQSLHAFKDILKQHANRDSMRVNETLLRCKLGLAAFTISTFMIMGLLLKANRDRRRAVESLYSSNCALTGTEEIEKQRASILEMVGTHVALSRILMSISELPAKYGVGAVIWTASEAGLHYEVSATLPNALASELAEELPLSDQAAMVTQFADYVSALARQYELIAGTPKVLRDDSGQLIGILQTFSSPAAELVPTALVDQMGQLAALAIDNGRLHERLEFQAQYDTLTQLPNRVLFDDRVEQAARLAVRHHKRTAVIRIDLDRSQKIHDNLGHAAGDAVLCEVARRLKGCLRESDTVARIGGDEFAVLAQDMGSAPDAELVCGKLFSVLAQPIRVGGHQVTVRASGGVSLFPQHGEDAATLIRNAELAMYSAQRAGGNTYQLFRAALDDSMQHRLQMEQHLKLALEKQEFSLEYQPLFDQNGKLDAVEGLLRWTNASLGAVAPEDFIPVAEDLGLISRIGEWALSTALSDAAAWMEHGFAAPRMALNVSAVQFVDQNFVSMVQRVLGASGFPAFQLEFEISEYALMNNIDSIIEQIQCLRGLGVRFSIDGFGAGYSSLWLLRNLSVDSVKIDPSFIQDLRPADENCTTLLRGIIALAHNLQMDVIAKGVETQHQLSTLRALGCDINQGYFLQGPVAAGQVEQLLPRAAGEAAPGAQDVGEPVLSGSGPGLT